MNILRKLIRNNYLLVASMPGKRGNIDIAIGDDSKWVNVYFKSVDCRISIHRDLTTIDSVSFTLPYTEDIWIEFYNELKEVLQ
jgi:hypothetical protein